jgi:hypothetical protein
MLVLDKKITMFYNRNFIYFYFEIKMLGITCNDYTKVGKKIEFS